LIPAQNSRQPSRISIFVVDFYFEIGLPTSLAPLAFQPTWPSYQPSSHTLVIPELLPHRASPSIILTRT
jgi:hypothetical protein